MIIGNRDFDVKNHTYIMGILNVTPDSFSDGGSYSEKGRGDKVLLMDKVLYRVDEMINEGMDILDIGGESTRPGADYVSAEEELGRVIPIIEAVKSRFDIPISLDTYKWQVAKDGIAAGVDLINDIWGLRFDKEMAKVIAEGGVACCLMHNDKEIIPAVRVMDGVIDGLKETIKIAKDAGIADDRIILDPGVGFAKDTEGNLIILNNLNKFNELGYPVLLGSSRKSVIGNTLNLPVDERVNATVATSVLAVKDKMAFVRVHDIKQNFEAVKMTEAIINS